MPSKKVFRWVVGGGWVVHKVIIVSVRVLYVGFSISLVFGFRGFGFSGFQVFGVSGFRGFRFSGFRGFGVSRFQVFRFFGQDGTLGFTDGTGRGARQKFLPIFRITSPPTGLSFKRLPFTFQL